MRFIIFVVALLTLPFGMLAQIQIKGTKCSLTPPSGFVPATAFSGFQHTENGASIMVIEMPTAFASVEPSMTESALKSKGMKLLQTEAVDIQGKTGKMVKVSQVANGQTYLKQILIFGTDTYTVMVNGIFPEAAKAIEEEIKTALRSTTYDENLNQNPVDAASCIIDPTGTAFKPSKYMAGSLIYSTEDKIPTTKPIMMVGNSISKVDFGDKKTFATERLKKLPRGDKSTIKSTTPVTIDGLDGFEIIADGKTKNDEPELVYQVILFGTSGDYYLIVGQAKDDIPANLKVFQALAKTFKRK